MKKEFWFEAMRVSLVKIKKARTIEQALVARTEFEYNLDNLVRLLISNAGVDARMEIPPRPGFFKRLLIWIKSFKQVF